MIPPTTLANPFLNFSCFRTSITATVHVGYTGAGIFPGRCFGLAVGIGEFQTSHWVGTPSLASYGSGQDADT